MLGVPSYLHDTLALLATRVDDPDREAEALAGLDGAHHLDNAGPGIHREPALPAVGHAQKAETELLVGIVVAGAQLERQIESVTILPRV